MLLLWEKPQPEPKTSDGVTHNPSGVQVSIFIQWRPAMRKLRKMLNTSPNRGDHS
jgi:hypothetical protein